MREHSKKIESRYRTPMTLFLLLAACFAPKTLTVSATEAGPEDAHYVIVRGQKVYDCMSMPDGSTWEPMCVAVQWREEPVGIRRDSPEGPKEPEGTAPQR